MKLRDIVPIYQVLTRITIDHTEPFDAGTGLRIKKILDETELSYTYYTQEVQNIIREYCEMDENGELKLDESGSLIFKDAETAQAKMNELDDTDVADISIHFNIKEFEGLSLPYEDVSKLSPIVDF